MTQRCFITLNSLPKSNSNPHMRDANARALYGTSAFSGCLNVSRQTLFSEGARETKGFSISGVRQKLSMKFDHLASLRRDNKYDSTYEAAGLILREATGGKAQ